jgi:hypothetical protein
MLNLFGTPEPTNTNARGRQNVSVGGATAATVPATKGGGERRDGLKRIVTNPTKLIQIITSHNTNSRNILKKNVREMNN